VTTVSYYVLRFSGTDFVLILFYEVSTKRL